LYVYELIVSISSIFGFARETGLQRGFLELIR
jgi:hypothetical protein